ncbi:prostaglandin F2 receptor negative regulator isoform X1 [Paramormyrops kingsleyae]|uniref:prostaglandin F2 receptor negative regulator isoform X1 n=1 Tax=Paramormyrops kingsleyae TaxID=1676925 RepID=UPI003B977E37
MNTGKKEMTSLTYLFLFLMFGSSQGRVVTVPFSPLVRVAGQTVSIRCDVIKYEGPQEQDFEWEVFKGGQTLQLISTFDNSFPNTIYIDRIHSGAIKLVRLKDNVVELRIANASVADDAIYRCATPSTDSSISGNYFADVELKVIEDNLKVSPVAAPAVVLEGSELQLRCNAARDLSDRTYLSVTWSIQRGTSPSEDIVTFGPDNVLKPGPTFAQRYADGGMRIDVREGGAFILTLTESLPSDQGTYTCQAQQWVLEGKNSWQSIMGRSVQLGEVKVTAIQKNLKVSVEKPTLVSMGDNMRLNCSISADNLPSLGLELDWLVSITASASPSTLVQMSRDGIVQNVSRPVGLTRIKPGLFGLLVHDVDQSSSGFYSCRVRAWIRQSSGLWYPAAQKVSDPVEVQVSLPAPEFKVNLSGAVIPQSTGDPMELDCHVTDVSHLGDGRLAVTWQRGGGAPGDLPASSQLIGGLDHHGDLSPGDAYQQLVKEGQLVLSKVKPDTFKLRFLQMSAAGMGLYSCTISAWTRLRDGSWQKAGEVHSGGITISWASRKPDLAVKAEVLRNPASPGGTFEMSCQATVQNLQGEEFSVLIQKTPAAGGNTQKIISLSENSILKLEGWSQPDRLDDVILQKVGRGNFQFRMSGAQPSDGGAYFCDVAAWTRESRSGWSRTISAESNRVSLAFSGPDLAANVSIRLDSRSTYTGDSATMVCSMTAQDGPANTNQYEVQFYRTSTSDPDNSDLLISKRQGLPNKSQRCEMKGCEMYQINPWTYRFSVNNLQHSDSGEYHCKVTSWLQNSPLTSTKGYEVVSEKVLLTVKFSVWRSVQMPLLYGCGISLVVGLLSVLIGYIFARCLQHGGIRSQSKLMDIEMD